MAALGGVAQALDAAALVDRLDVDEHGLGGDPAQAEVDRTAAEVAPNLGDRGGVGPGEGGYRDRVTVAQGVAEAQAVVGEGDRDEVLQEVSARNHQSRPPRKGEASITSALAMKPSSGLKGLSSTLV